MLPLAFISNLARGPGLIVFLVILLMFGARRLPELGKSIGETVRELKKSKEEREADERAEAEKKKA